jgi:hypothetical protein
LAVAPTMASAQGHDDHDAQPGAVRPLTAQQNDLVEKIREVTSRFKRETTLAGPGQGYQLMFGCVSGGDFGAMGLHYVNGALLHDGDVDENAPEILLYEPLPNGRIRITGADFIVFKSEWDAKHPEGPPQLRGQLFHLFDSPNRFGLDPFYTLHVWAWKPNRAGTFSNWNPDVSCDDLDSRLLPSSH